MPIPYIIALVLGIVVLGLLAYWLYTGGVGFDKIISESTCRAKLGFYCNSWKINTFDEKKKPNNQDFSKACPIDAAEKDKYYAPDCCSFPWAREVTAASCQS